eukprot:TRINITY_DN3196_c0_g1_i1.p1 TRINITY_DN3196_c0_g1~~TRINITY_DN3196_c0_g1_i1.p1  ORF type:complete len:1447 (+),score=641.41 TRINITY_DN3196_c0_g1_i1:187-4527(+)
MRKLFTVDHTTVGKGPVHFNWNKGGNHLAVCGANRMLCIFDRQGRPVDQKTLPNPGACEALEWDSTGDTLAVLQAGAVQIVLWHSAGKKIEVIDTGLKGLSFMKWNKNGPHLAVGTAKGNLLLYNKKTLKKVTSMGKHTKKITCGAWSSSGKLALGGEDKLITINTTEGDLIDQLPLRAEPQNLAFARIKSDTKGKGEGESGISVTLDYKTLLLADVNNLEDRPTELAFLPEYGNITSYKWFGDGYILVGFGGGRVIVVSTHSKEILQEISHFQPHQESLSDVTYCPALQKGASIGDSSLQIFNMNDINSVKLREENYHELDNEYNSLKRLEWTEDGQILTVSSEKGNIHSFLTKIPVLHDVYESKVLLLTSLRELVVRDVVKNQDIAHISVEIEPTFLSLGPDRCAVGMNNCVWYYALVPRNSNDRKGTRTASIISQRSYVNSVQYVRLSADYAAVMSEGKVTLHMINQQESGNAYGSDAAHLDGMPEERRQQRVFPEKDGDSKITSVAMTPKFLVYGTSNGSIVYFSLEDWCVISEYRNTIGIRSVHPNALGTRLAFIDETNEANIYSPVDDTMCKVQGFSMDTDKIIWDPHEWGVFVGCGVKKFTTYVYAPNTRWGPRCVPVYHQSKANPTSEEIYVTDRPMGFAPILVHGGGVMCQTVQHGTLLVVSLAARNFTSSHPSRIGHEQKEQAFFNLLNMNKLEAAWEFAKQINDREIWYALGDKALHLLDVNMAMRVYRMVNQPAMVMALDPLRHVNEKAMLLGHVAMLFKNFNEAQNHFMRSSDPKLALSMRRDLMDWNAALELSKQLSPSSIPYISREYASQLEFKGELQHALDMYNKGFITEAEEVSEKRRREISAHNEQCNAGLARITIRMGDITRGFQIAMQMESQSIATECAQLFEELKQWTEAAQLYEKAQDYDKAAYLYICQSKSLKAAATLMPYITSSKIQRLYGQAKEREGSYREAKDAFAVAEDWDSVVRLLVSHLNDISSAYDVVRRTKSAEAAALVAQHCKKDGNPETAIEFLLLAKKTEEAFDLASSSNHMHTYAAKLGNDGAPEDYINLAKYYQETGQFLHSGDYFLKSKKYGQALQRYLDAANTLEEQFQGVKNEADVPKHEKQVDECINKAIAVVGEAQSDKLNKVLITYLTADDSNDTPKDPKYLFSLYMALGKYERGSGMAIVIARREQQVGHYRIAHRLLFQTYKQLDKHGIAISSELRWNLMLLHSYLLAKPLMKTLNDHALASRMLIRVAKNIQKFPQHVVPILTSCVTECNKSGFDKSAYQYAKELVTGHRKEIAEKHKKRMDTIVRKPGFYSKQHEGAKRLTEAELTDPVDEVGPCPFCATPLPMSMLDCPRCKNNVPFCIATGQHMLMDEWTQCPSCKFPALYDPFCQLIRDGEPCPMCEDTIDLGDVRKLTNPDPKLWQKSGQDSGQPAEESKPEGAEA